MVDEILQLIEEFLRRLETIRRHAGHGLLQELVQPGIDVGVHFPEIRQATLHHPLAGFLRRGAFEDVLAREQHGQHDTGREDVRPFVRDLEIRLLRTHVLRLAGDLLTLLVLQEPTRLGDAEVGQLHVALEGDHDVLGAHIPVDDTEEISIPIGLGMGVGQPTSHTRNNEHRQLDGQLPSPLLQLLAELLQVHPTDELHADVTGSAGLPEMVGLDDIGVDQVRHQLGLPDEVLDELRLPGVLLADDLDRNTLQEAPRSMLESLVDNAHSAFIDLADDFVAQFTGNGGHLRHGAMVRG